MRRDGGGNHREGVRGVRRAGPSACAPARAGGGPGQLGAHKGDRSREMVEDKGCELVFLPAYSPDLNPIEEAFSKVKALS